MKHYDASNIRDLEGGWYWEVQWEGAVPQAVLCYWTVRGDGLHTLTVDRGYDPKNSYISPDAPALSDGYDTLHLLGPIPMPTEDEVRGK